MKKFSLFITSWIVCSYAFTQDIEKRYFDNNSALGGDVVIKSASVQVVGDNISKTFEIDFINYITPSVSVEIGKPVPTLYSNLVEYSKRLLTKEEADIKSAIQNVFTIEEDFLDIDITTNNHNILLNFRIREDTNIDVKIYNLFGILTYKTTRHISKGEQSIVINTANFEKGVYAVQVIIKGKTISKKINITE